MKLILLAALIAATPAMAQEVPAAPATPDATTAPPAPATDTGVQPTAGGYQPAHPALSGPVPPGVTPQFVQAPPPAEAFPAPAPLAHYPLCKKGQFDKCMQRN